MAPTEKMQKLLNTHAIERLMMEVRQAQDWLDFYEKIEPNETLAKAWEKTVNHRFNILMGAKQHVYDAEVSPTT